MYFLFFFTFIQLTTAQVRLSRSNLFLLCSCDSQTDYIDLNSAKISAVDEKTFSGLKNLQYLALNNNQIKSLDSKVFVLKTIALKFWMQTLLNLQLV